MIILKSIMEDHRELNKREIGVSAVFWHPSYPQKEYSQRIDQLKQLILWKDSRGLQSQR